MSTTSRRSVSFSRRSFVEKMGLGVGAAMLAPLAKNLITEAQGQAVDRKIATLWLVANGMNPLWSVTPEEFIEQVDRNNVEPGAPTNAVPDGRNWTVPGSFLPLAPYQDRMLILDGLKNHPYKGEDAGHGMSYMALSCVPGSDADNLLPGGITFDQQLAKTLSAATPKKAILIGQSTKSGDFKNTLFAGGANQAIPAFQNPAALFRDLFGSGMAQMAGMMPGGNAKKGQVLLHALKTDIQRLELSFAGEERKKLESYLNVIKDHENSIALTANLNCAGGTPPAEPAEREPVTALVSLHAIATVALVCGMSNVMCMDVGCGESHDQMPEFRALFADGTYFGADAARLNGLLAMGESGFSGIGHDPRAVGGEVLKAVHQWISGMMAKTIEALKVANLYDNSLSLFTSDNAETHHSQHVRWPLVIVGNAGGKFKADNRFIRFPAQSRSMQDLFTTIGTAFGASMDGFALDPNEKDLSQGPLTNLI